MFFEYFGRVGEFFFIKLEGGWLIFVDYFEYGL